LKLDLGCGPNKKEGFTGVDRLQFDGKVDIVCDLGKDRWPFEDDTVEEFHCSHMVEHLDWSERVHFFNELHRVLKKGAKGQLVLPHWASSRYYGDPTHKTPFSEFAFYYLNADWRKANAPHADAGIAPGPLAYSCNFDAGWGYSLRQDLTVRNTEYQQYAIQNFKEACQDIISTLTKK
jgi:hypothetical protein